MRLSRILVRLLIGFAPAAALAGTAATSSITTDTPPPFDSVRATTITWDCNASGTCTALVNGIAGQVVRLYYDPGANGVAPSGASPSANYDITLSDQYGFDVLRGTGQNLSATVNKTVSWPTSGEWVQDTLTLSVSGAGASGEGTLRIVTRR